MKELVEKAAQVAPLLKITRDDINNKVRKIRARANNGKSQQQFLTMQPAAQPFQPIWTQTFPLV
jgi:hypothetical protein